MLKLEWIFEGGKCVQVRWVKQEATELVSESESKEEVQKAS